MPRSTDGAGLRRDRRVAVVRGIGFGIAVALGAVAVWLIVTSSSLKSMRIGALAGFIPALVAVRAKVIDALRF